LGTAIEVPESAFCLRGDRRGTETSLSSSDALAWMTREYPSAVLNWRESPTV
jgi:hypothetical protein